jgi:hypothetical protein
MEDWAKRDMATYAFRDDREFSGRYTGINMGWLERFHNVRFVHHTIV